MSATTHNDASLQDDGFHEIQLSGKQLVFLFMSGATLAVLIFLCGVQVGRNAKGDRIASADTADTLASAAAAQPVAATPSVATPSSGPPAAEPPAPAQEPDDELSYAKRLQASDPAAGDKVSPAPKAAEPKPVENKPAPPAQFTAALPAKPAAAEPGGASKPGSWIVQLTALQDRGAAVTIAHQLAAKGYPAFVVDPSAGAPVIYRVQVGGYPDADKANQVAHRLEKEEHYKPYVRSR